MQTISSQRFEGLPPDRAVIAQCLLIAYRRGLQLRDEVAKSPINSLTNARQIQIEDAPATKIEKPIVIGLEPA